MGPYVVVKQSTLSSVQLQDPITGHLVDGGVDIPLEQVTQGLKRSLLEFEHCSAPLRTVGQMMEGQMNAGALPPEIEARGWKPGKKAGWKGLVRGSYLVYRAGPTRELIVAMVLYNDRESQTVEVQTC